MQDTAKDLNAALRSYWLTILLIFLACSATSNIFYWGWLPNASSDSVDPASNLLFAFIAYQQIVISTCLTFALGFHVPLLLTSNPYPQRSFKFFVLFTLFLIGSEILSFFPSVAVNCTTGKPVDDEAYGLSMSCYRSSAPGWLLFALALIIAILSFLCLLNIVQAAKGAVQSKLQERKQSR